nr:hypothetical protein [Tanacetum cinerariifolium]
MKTGGGSYPPLPTQGTYPTGNTPRKSSYVNIIGESSKKTVNIYTLITPGGMGLMLLCRCSQSDVNTTYGFFLGKRVAYPVVASYVRNTLGKFCLVKSMLNSSTELFSFQFRSTDGLNSMLENGPWFIRNHPLILQKWNQYVDLLKEDVATQLGIDTLLFDHLIVDAVGVCYSLNWVLSVGMERDFLSQKDSGVGRGFKEKDASVSNIEAVKEKDLNDEPMAMEVQSPLVDQTYSMKTGGGSYPPLPTQGTNLTRNTPRKSSYVNVIGESSKKTVNIYTLITLRGMGLMLLCRWSQSNVNTKYGFFLGKRVAYPVVANYVRNTWGKFCLVKSMLNSSTELFSFQFRPTDEDVWNVPVWVKLHGVLVTASSEDGLSAIVTKIGTSLILDSYTFDVYLQSWGRLTYARVMIELRANVKLKDTVMVFGHTQEECPKIIGLVVVKNLKKPSQTFRCVSVGSK